MHLPLFSGPFCKAITLENGPFYAVTFLGWSSPPKSSSCVGLSHVWSRTIFTQRSFRVSELWDESFTNVSDEIAHILAAILHPEATRSRFVGIKRCAPDADDVDETKKLALYRPGLLPLRYRWVPADLVYLPYQQRHIRLDVGNLAEE